MKDQQEKDHYIFPQVDWELEKFEHEGFVLDIGGGGEGVIGQLMDKDVVAIDFRKEELLEAADGPLKIIMDARELKFLDDSFQTASAFFSLMYIKKREDQHKVFEEISRVLKPGGKFHIWDVDLKQKPKTDQEIFIVHLKYSIGGRSKETGYGMRWPKEPRGFDDYLGMAKKTGFREVETRWVGNTFYLCLEKYQG
ncbi:MAG: methyltransferase domain-containing protein [Anaerolineales bacterium]|nr:methyltransferase domain-containing protein [Anaerolineales bacterium]